MKKSMENGLPWPELTRGILIKRYKRFLADVALDDGREVTAHCANSGAMLECCEPGRPVYLSFHDNPKRKLKYTWEMIEMPDSLVGVNTIVPNRLVKNALENRLVPELKEFVNIRSEVKVSDASRLDILAETVDGDKCYVEIKNCTLATDGVGYFPDAVTTRGRKHLVELQTLVKEGNRAIIFFLVQRMDVTSFAPAVHIDPAYAAELEKALEAGVEILVYDVEITLERIMLGKRIQMRD